MTARPDRLNRIRAAIDEREEIDALLITDPHNRRYASGFTGSNGWLLISARHARLATDFRYLDQAADQSPGFEVVQMKGKMEEWLPSFIEPANAAKLGFESAHLSFAAHAKLHEEIGKLSAKPELVPVSGILEPIRAEKDEPELDAMRRAAKLSDDALAHVLALARPDWTERRLAWEIELYARTHGADAMAFDSIVAAGPEGARPHARPREEPLGEGRPIVIDMGARVDGYCSDMTRTVVLGRPDDEFKAVYDIVLAAQETAAQMIEPGMACSDAHQLAQQVIDDAGYGERFGHGLGHGVGLQIHEHPHIGKTSEDILAEGMVVTIEPGIYLPEWGGVRIEDMGVIADGAFHSFTSSPKHRMIGSAT